MTGRGVRIATALLVIGLCLVTSAGAVSMLRLAIIEMSIDGATPTNAAAVAARFASLRDDPVAGGRARAGLLSRSNANDAPDLEKIEEFLAVAPLASGAWRELARARLHAGRPTTAILAALEMARITGPNEGHEMAARAFFGLPLWAMLPAQTRNDLIRDLVGGWVAIEDPERAALRLTLSLARPESRGEIEASLRRAGKAGVAPTQALGLGAVGLSAVEEAERTGAFREHRRGAFQ